MHSPIARAIPVISVRARSFDSPHVRWGCPQALCALSAAALPYSGRRREQLDCAAATYREEQSATSSRVDYQVKEVEVTPE